ncbi:hypothetical protein [Clostridium fallax]|uniref:Tellurite resistance protein TerB n=1 Tax=Clostridium fallax TaxID=1533 RepID=A0A1M4SIZ7_9CLOT|nr:hypothetical protein [Clostridium fallax]SHE32180.1 hypothetical protein SAMN05443638_10148 [Clostridium fallax]SQB07850.1 Uncharacterised protein [Clostridium fallax]
MDNKYKELEDIINEKAPQLVDAFTYYSKDKIPRKKLEKAMRYYAKGVEESTIIGLIDLTLFGSSKEGVLFTNEGFYLKESFEKPLYILYKDIEDVTVTSAEKDCNRVLIITSKNGTINKIKTSLLKKTPFMEILLESMNLCLEGLVGENDKYIILECMDESIKINYIKAVINLISIDEKVNYKKIVEIYSLMTQINVSKEGRSEIKEYIMSKTKENLYEVLDKMEENVPEASEKILHLSLIKDMIGRCISLNSYNDKEKEIIHKISKKYKINDEQVEFLKEACENDFKIMNFTKDDSEIIKDFKEIATKAAAVGVPVAAVYLSGSVVGLSAEGITSGLAALGLGGVLGLSSMVTGLGVALIVGFGIYRGMKWLSINEKKEKHIKSQFLVEQAIRSNQKIVSNLVEDITSYTSQLIELLKDSNKNTELIEKIGREINIYGEALNYLNIKSEKLEKYL